MDKSALFSTTLVKALSVLGGIWTAYQVYNVLRFVNLHFVRRSSLPRYQHGLTRSWALITGASDGIGRGFAEELCQRGFNVVLHGRNEKKLQGVKAELLRQWPESEIRIIVIDAAYTDRNAVEAVAIQLQDINLTVLINNVGGAGPIKKTWETLANRSGADVDVFMDLNARFPTQITRVVLPMMLKNKPSLILNVGSAAGEFPAAYATVYSGSKNFNKAWSWSLGAELKAEKQDVEVLTVLVGMVQSGSAQRATSFLVPTSRRMAAASLNMVGCGKSAIWAYWPHALQFGVLGMLPDWFTEKAVINIALKEKAIEEKGN